MIEFLIYVGITIVSLLMFFWWYKRVDYKAEKNWLLEQIKQADESVASEHIKALKALEQEYSHKSKSLSTTLWITLMVAPATFAIDYIWFQTIPISERISVADMQQETPDLNTAIAQLEEQLAENPDDLDGQMLYASAMMQLQRYDNAVGALKKATQLAPDNAHILTELAEAVAFRNNTGSFLGEPEPYLQQALDINPNHQKAMWLQGIVFYEKRAYEQAETIWSALLEQVESPNIRQTITTQINQAREALNKSALEDMVPHAGIEYLVAIGADESIQNMSLDPAARIFVYAREINGMPMPIAAIPINQPFSWPISVRLNDQHNLDPNRKLSSFEAVEFSAKLSLSGDATPAAGDIASDLVIGDQESTTIKLMLSNNNE